MTKQVDLYSDFTRFNYEIRKSSKPKYIEKISTFINTKVFSEIFIELFYRAMPNCTNYTHTHTQVVQTCVLNLTVVMQNFVGLETGTFLIWLKCNLDFPCTLTRFFLHLIFLTFFFLQFVHIFFVVSFCVLFCFSHASTIFCLRLGFFFHTHRGSCIWHAHFYPPNQLQQQSQRRAWVS